MKLEILSAHAHSENSLSLSWELSREFDIFLEKIIIPDKVQIGDMHLVFSSREYKNYWKNRNAKITLTPHSNRWSNESSAMKLIPLIPLSLGDCNHNTRGTHAYALSSVSIIYYWSVPSKTRCYIHIKIHIWSNVDRKITPIKKIIPFIFWKETTGLKP